MLPVVWRCGRCHLPVWLRFGYEQTGMTLRFHVTGAINVHMKQHERG